MKKIVIAAALSAMLSSTALAEAENNFYITAKAGTVITNKAKDTDFGMKMKSKPAAVFGLGVGYYAMDNVRADLTLDIPVKPELKKNGQDKNSKTNNLKHKCSIYALMANGYVDLFDISVAKVFVGGGIGWAQVKEKGSSTVNNVTNTWSTKKANNIAYQLTLGTAAEVAPGVKAELAYSWKDFGKTSKTVKGGSTTPVSKTAYKGHNITAGVRFDI